jgi:hypothetical protein
LKNWVKIDDAPCFDFEAAEDCAVMLLETVGPPPLNSGGDLHLPAPAGVPNKQEELLKRV